MRVNLHRLLPCWLDLACAPELFEASWKAWDMLQYAPRSHSMWKIDLWISMIPSGAQHHRQQTISLWIHKIGGTAWYSSFITRYVDSQIFGWCEDLKDSSTQSRLIQAIGMSNPWQVLFFLPELGWTDHWIPVWATYMLCLYLHIWIILGINVGTYSIHCAYLDTLTIITHLATPWDTLPSLAKVLSAMGSAVGRLKRTASAMVGSQQDTLTMGWVQPLDANAPVMAECKKLRKKLPGKIVDMMLGVENVGDCWYLYKPFDVEMKLRWECNEKQGYNCTYWLAGHLFTQNSMVSSVELLFYRDIIHFQTHLYAFMNADEQKGYIQLAHHPSM